MSDNLFFMVKATPTPKDPDNVIYEEIPLYDFLKNNVSIDESIHFFYNCTGTFDFEAIIDAYGTYQDLYNSYLSNIADTIAEEIDACGSAEWYDYNIEFIYE